MPRKRSVSGRARAKTAENALQLQAEKINRRLRSLEKAGNYGVYKSKELIRFAQSNPYVTIKKSRGSRRHRLIISKIKKTIAETRLIRKKLSNIMKSKVFSNVGISQVRKETRESLKQTLGERRGEEITEADVDRFYEIAEYASKAREGSIMEKIDPSKFEELVAEAKERNLDVDSWVSLLSEYVIINNDYMRKEAEELYYKYVA